MKHLTILALVILAAASLFVLASRPPANLAADTVTGGDGPAVQGITDSSAQPVNIMNWLIDENGNVRVSIQVRDEMHRLVTPEAPLHLATDETWQSEWIDARRFNVVRISLNGADAGPVLKYYITTWGEGHEDAQSLDSSMIRASYRHGVIGPQIGLRITCNVWGSGCTIFEASMYLRAE